MARIRAMLLMGMACICLTLGVSGSFSAVPKRRAKAVMPQAPVAQKKPKAHRWVARRKKRKKKRKRRKKKYAQDFAPRYRHRWDSRCPKFGISRRACYRATRRGKVKKIHGMAMKILAWWKKQMDNTSPAALKQIIAKRDKYFHVSRWWWDRYRRDAQFWAMDVVDRMVQPVLLQLPEDGYKQLLDTSAALLDHKALSRPREVALISRLSRWMKRRPYKSLQKKLVKRFSAAIFREKKCHWWYVVFIATFSPRAMKRVGAKIEPAWCKYRRYYLRSKFRTPKQLGAELRRLHKKYRYVTRLHKLGSSAEGRPIWALKVGKVRDSNAPTTLLVGGQHGDEHMGGELLTHYAGVLLKRYGKGEAQVRRWLKTRQIWFIPCVNPDGYHFDLLGGVIKWWRYNRGVQPNGEIGVDLNRNWDFKWKKFTYYRWGRIELPGRKPFSEPETRVIQKISWKIRKLTGILDVHQSGSVVLMPWAYTRTKLPGIYQRLFVRISRYLTAFNRYRVWHARRLYPHQATLGDWGFGRHKVLSLVLELGRTVYVNERQKKRIYRDNRVLLDRWIKLATDPFQKIRKIGRSN